MIKDIPRSWVLLLILGLAGLAVASPELVQVSDIAANVQRVASAEDQENAQYKDAVQLIRRNASCFEAKSLEAYLDTLTPSAREQTEALSKLIMSCDLELTVDITSFDILSDGTDKAVRVRVMQLTKKVGGSARFVDNEVDCIHTVVLTDDGWKISNTEVIAINQL